MKVPRGKIKLNSLPECSTRRKVDIRYETFEGEIKFESLTICGTGRKDRDSL